VVTTLRARASVKTRGLVLEGLRPLGRSSSLGLYGPESNWISGSRSVLRSFLFVDLRGRSLVLCLGKVKFYKRGFIFEVTDTFFAT